MAARHWLLLLVVLILMAWAWSSNFNNHSLLESLSRQESDLRNWYRQSPWLVGVLIFLIYTLMMALPLPVSLPATLICGWICGFSTGLVLVSFASTLAASITFCLSRYCFSSLTGFWFESKITRWRNLPMRDVASLLFLLRLTPGIPFFVINAGFGLSSLRLSRFWMISQLGMLPATVIHVYLGSQLPTLNQLAHQGMGSLMSRDLMICLALVGSLPLLMRLLASRLWRRQDERVGQSQKK